MARIWICNASPIIILAKAGHLTLLSDPTITVLVPAEVVSEILAGPPQDPAREMVIKGWGERIEIQEIPNSVLQWGLGAGESAVLGLALQKPGAVAILDDSEARTCSRALGIPLMGTLGIVLRAARMKTIAAAAPVVHDLRRAGFRLGEELIRDALRQALGEDWSP
ncbi:MAG: DUF3368 domain-containing protein [Planctomycetota bacterium]